MGGELAVSNHAEREQSLFLNVRLNMLQNHKLLKATHKHI